MIFIGLGSSIGNAEEIFDSVEKSLEREEIQVLQKSQIFENPPYGVARNEFSNTVWEIETSLSPQGLLKVLLQIESQHGRTREVKWGDRTLDLDLLIFHDEVLDTPDLQVPHPEIAKRDFVLRPLAELVDKSFQIPTFGALSELLENL